MANVTDFKAIKDATVTKDGNIVLAFEVQVIPGLDSEPELLKFYYNITSMTSTTMTLKLSFKNPIEVSTLDIETLKIIFNDPLLLIGSSGEMIEPGT